MNTDAATLYRELGRLVETMPDLRILPVPPETRRWVGRAFALVSDVCGPADRAIFTTNADSLGSVLHESSVNTVTSIVFRALAIAERNAPFAMQGSFIPAGSAFDAFAAVSKVLSLAKADILIVDPYLDEAILTEFAQALPEGIQLRLLADEACVKGSLRPAAERWLTQYGSVRPLAVRLSGPKTLHDRALLLDSQMAYTLTQSLKDFAKRSPAEIVRVDDTAAMKIDAYEALWASATPLV